MLLNTFPTFSEVLELTTALCRIRSVSDRVDDLRTTIDLVERFFDGTSLSIQRYEQNGKPSIVITTTNTTSPDICMVGHIDVVPGRDDQFEPKTDGDRLIARGTCDMKSEVAVMMALMKCATPSSSQPSLGLILTSDEELGGHDGVRYLVEDLGYRAQVAIVPDGGRAPNDLIVKTKGIVRARLTATGRTAHASRPWEGTNALDVLIESYQRVVRELIPMTQRDDHWHITSNLGVMNGGTAANQVPDAATCTLDIRFPEDVDLNVLKTTIARIASPCVVEFPLAEHPSLTQPDNIFVKSYGDLLRADLHLDAQCNGSHGGNDGRFFTAHQIPVITSRPVSGDQHGPEEWVSLSSLEAYTRFYGKLINEFGRLVAHS